MSAKGHRPVVKVTTFTLTAGNRDELDEWEIPYPWNPIAAEMDEGKIYVTAIRRCRQRDEE